MSRYIDADKVLAYISRLLGVLPLVLLNEYEKNGIDIVRCKECKYESICNHSVQHITHDAYSVTIGSKTVEWCSYGEREDK